MRRRGLLRLLVIGFVASLTWPVDALERVTVRDLPMHMATGNYLATTGLGYVWTVFDEPGPLLVRTSEYSGISAKLARLPEAPRSLRVSPGGAWVVGEQHIAVLNPDNGRLIADWRLPAHQHADAVAPDSTGAWVVVIVWDGDSATAQLRHFDLKRRVEDRRRVLMQESPTCAAEGAGGLLYVACDGYGSNLAPQLYRVDSHTGAVQAQVPTSRLRGVTYAARSSTGTRNLTDSLYALDVDHGQLARYNPNTLAIEAVAPLTGYALPTVGRNWVWYATSSSLVALEPITLTVTRVVLPPGGSSFGPGLASADRRWAWVAGLGADGTQHLFGIQGS